MISVSTSKVGSDTSPVVYTINNLKLAYMKIFTILSRLGKEGQDKDKDWSGDKLIYLQLISMEIVSEEINQLIKKCKDGGKFQFVL